MSHWAGYTSSICDEVACGDTAGPPRAHNGPGGLINPMENDMLISRDTEFVDTIPACTGDCAQGRRPCKTPAACQADIGTIVGLVWAVPISVLMWAVVALFCVAIIFWS